MVNKNAVILVSFLLTSGAYFYRHGSGKMGVAVKATPTPPLSGKSSTTKSKSSGRAKAKSQHSQEKHSNLSSPYAFSLNGTPSPATKQVIPSGHSVLMVTVKDKTVKVHLPTDSAPRSPTLVECKAIIKHQQETNKKQEQEVNNILVIVINIFIRSVVDIDILNCQGKHSCLLKDKDNSVGQPVAQSVTVSPLGEIGPWQQGEKKTL